MGNNGRGCSEKRKQATSTNTLGVLYRRGIKTINLRPYSKPEILQYQFDKSYVLWMFIAVKAISARRQVLEIAKQEKVQLSPQKRVLLSKRIMKLKKTEAGRRGRHNPHRVQRVSTFMSFLDELISMRELTQAPNIKAKRVPRVATPILQEKKEQSKNMFEVPKQMANVNEIRGNITVVAISMYLLRSFLQLKKSKMRAINKSRENKIQQKRVKPPQVEREGNSEAEEKNTPTETQHQASVKAIREELKQSK